MGHLNIIIAGAGEKGGNLNAPIFKSLNTRWKGVAREGSGSSEGRGPREREDPRGRGVPWGKLRLRIDRRKKESFSIPPNL